MILKQQNKIFIKVTMIQLIRNFSQLIVGNYTICMFKKVWKLYSSTAKHIPIKWKKTEMDW